MSRDTYLGILFLPNAKNSTYLTAIAFCLSCEVKDQMQVLLWDKTQIEFAF